MIRSHKLEGIVIKRSNYSEIDRIVTIFSRSRGKIVVLAKGIRKINSRKAPHLELFTQCFFTIIDGKTFDYIIESQTITSFANIRNDLKKLAFAYRIAEITDRIVPEREEYPKIFEMLVTVFDKINRADKASLAEYSDQFVLELLWELGFMPRGEVLKENKLQSFLENIMERTLKSDSLLKRI